MQSSLPSAICSVDAEPAGVTLLTLLQPTPGVTTPHLHYSSCLNRQFKPNVNLLMRRTRWRT